MKVKKGLDLPINGSPSNDIDGSKTVTQVAITGPDYHGMKPTMNVEVGDKVKLGQVVFVDKKQPGVKYTSPASGEVIAVNRGDKRVFQTLVIKVSGNDEVTFNSHSEDQILGLSEENVRSQLIESGLWTTIRTRPFSRTPAIDSKPAGIFVSTIDTRPLAANPGLIIDLHAKEFKTGLEVLSKLTDGKVYLNKAINQIIPGAESHFVETNTWEGPHPAGLVGTHIHNLLPASISRVVWTVGYQDVIAIGSLFLTGKIFTDRYVALGGPAAKNPRILKTKLGACLDELLKGEEKETEYEARTISGSVLDGRTASGNLCFLGQWSNQVTLIEEGHKREFFIVDGWLSHGINKYSLFNSYFGRLIPGLKFNFTTTTNGSKRAMVPIGAYEKVMPLDILPTYLLRSLISRDTETAQDLGCLELDEEDLALCTFVCPGKYEYAPILRENLEKIERDG
jgi:Na+-transporting NADH:ubiquinone oxidoreductase subunit A